ncbi:MAG TPA: LptA/OstA family protein, partial [Acidimicrobiales bacterium]
DQQATANQADYSADTQVLTLTGNPRLADPDTRMRADRFMVHLATNTAEGLGHVSSAHFGPFQETPKAPSPPLLRGEGDRKVSEGTLASRAGTTTIDSSDTTNVLADRVTADRASQYVHYEGHVRAWHGTDVVESPSLDIYRADRRIVSGYGVVTSGLAPGRAKGGPATTDAGHNGEVDPASNLAAAPEPVTIRADRLEYFDLGRKAMYRGHVRMDASGATLQAERLDAYFTSAGAAQGIATEATKLERAVADGNVTVVEPGRRAAGDHAEYFTAEGKLVMTGGPPTLYDAKAGFTTGQTLTFFTASDTLIIDGGKGSRALSKHTLSQ